MILIDLDDQEQRLRDNFWNFSIPASGGREIGAPLTFTEFYAGRVWTQRIRPAVTNVPIHVYASEAFAINIKRIPRFIRGIVNSRALPKLSSDEKNRRILVQRANLLAKKKATKNSMVTEEWGEHK